MKRVSQSPSRIKLFQDCSYKYYCRYELKLPDKSNDGAKRGTLVHLVLECLINPRHKKYIKQILSTNNASSIPSLARLIKKHQKRLDIADAENSKMVHEMIITGLNIDFSCSGAKQVIPEQNFKLETEFYDITGIIDKIAVYDDDIKITDYKTSKGKFKEEEIDGNLQVFMYSLYCYKVFNKIPTVEFLFLRFPKDPKVTPPKCTEEELKGFENYLNYLDGYLSDFTLAKATSNYAFHDVDKKWLCGYAKERGQLTKAGKPFFHCPYRFPFDYYALVDKETGMAVKTSEDPTELKETEKTKIHFKKFKGCPACGGKITHKDESFTDF